MTTQPKMRLTITLEPEVAHAAQQSGNASAWLNAVGKAALNKPKNPLVEVPKKILSGVMEHTSMSAEAAVSHILAMVLSQAPAGETCEV